MRVSSGRVIVTGATRGIGRATAESILERGGRVVGIARDEQALAELEAAYPTTLRGIAADLGDTDRLEDLADRAVDAFGGVEGLIHCAGVAVYEAVGGIEPCSVRTQLDVNLVAPLLLSQAVSSHMRERGGAIVHVSSTLAERVAQFTAVYAATKAALNAVTRTLALELAPFGIRVNAVLPGAVDTDMLRAPRLAPGESLTDAEIAARIEGQLDALRALHPLGRLGKPEEIASVILGALDQPWQTGSLITIDGGLSLG